jgi:aryl-alcohol dehydrogenase-like predicted oxidoreductase
MQRVLLANTSIQSSRIAFGTASLHHLRRPQREAVLLAALDHGITHFDTAPSYGFGIAERALAILPGRTDATVATKVGLYPPGGADGNAAMVLTRKLAGRFLPRLSRAVSDQRVVRARESFHGSLRRMRRDRVDILFLHEPRLELLACDEWMRWLESERDRLGAIGIAGEPQRLLPFVACASPFAAVIQSRDSVDREESAMLRAAGRNPQITYGHLVHRRAAVEPIESLRLAAARFPGTVFLVSTRRPERLRELARCVESVDPTPPGNGAR